MKKFTIILSFNLKVAYMKLYINVYYNKYLCYIVNKLFIQTYLLSLGKWDKHKQIR
jgi:hypothetical protein